MKFLIHLNGCGGHLNRKSLICGKCGLRPLTDEVRLKRTPKPRTGRLSSSLPNLQNLPIPGHPTQIVERFR